MATTELFIEQRNFNVATPLRQFSPMCIQSRHKVKHYFFPWGLFFPACTLVVRANSSSVKVVSLFSGDYGSRFPTQKDKNFGFKRTIWYKKANQNHHRQNKSSKEIDSKARSRIRKRRCLTHDLSKFILYYINLPLRLEITIRRIDNRVKFTSENAFR